jgi:lariat debranching enzyme
MSCPVKYHAIGDFHAYYSGATRAPYLTIFVGGNHEASSHMWELYYGGWAAPNIYYMGAANVVRVGGIRIAGMSGIWKGYNYNKPHYERLPYNQDDIRSIYHVRELDIRKLLQLKTQVDIGISHDWPKAVEKHGNARALFNMKPDFEQESKDGTLGNTAAAYVMDRLRPPYWFAAHMHCKFAATKVYEDAQKPKDQPAAPSINGSTAGNMERDVAPISVAPINGASVAHNADEIDLDFDDDDALAPKHVPTNSISTSANQDEISLEDDEAAPVSAPAPYAVPSDIRAQLPAAFSRPSQRTQPGQPTPPGVTNKTVRFLALDKCLPGRKFLQLLDVYPCGISANPSASVSPSSSRPQPKFEYDPEWLAITRVFATDLELGDKNARPSEDLGEAHYAPLIEKELEWVKENVVKNGKLEIPENFVLTAPPFQVGMPEIVKEGPVEYNHPQMQHFCDLVGIENKFFATDQEKQERMSRGPAAPDERFNRGGRGGRGRGWDRGGGGGGGRGRGRRRRRG